MHGLRPISNITSHEHPTSPGPDMFYLGSRWCTSVGKMVWGIVGSITRQGNGVPDNGGPQSGGGQQYLV